VSETAIVSRTDAPEVGIYCGIRDVTYHGWNCVSPSRAKSALISAKKYQASIERPKEETPAMVLGTVSHAAVWEPDTMLSRFVLWDGGRRAGKSWEQFEAANDGKTILLPDQYQAALEIRDSAYANPAVKAIVTKKGQRELSMRWEQECRTAPVTLQCKGRPDFVADRIYDLKTIRALTDRAMVRNVTDFGYLLSMGAYRHGRKLLTGEEMECVLIFIETQYPYDSAVKVLDWDDVDAGCKQWFDACEVIGRSIHSGEWPGYSDVETPLVLPDWAKPSSDTPLTLSIGGESVEM